MERRTLYLPALIVAAVLMGCAAAVVAVSEKAEAAFPSVAHPAFSNLAPLDDHYLRERSHRGSSMLQSANQRRRVVAALAPALMLPTGIPFPSTATSLSSRPMNRS